MDEARCRHRWTRLVAARRGSSSPPDNDRSEGAASVLPRARSVDGGPPRDVLRRESLPQCCHRRSTEEGPRPVAPLTMPSPEVPRRRSLASRPSPDAVGGGPPQDVPLRQSVARCPRRRFPAGRPAPPVPRTLQNIRQAEGLRPRFKWPEVSAWDVRTTCPPRTSQNIRHSPGRRPAPAIRIRRQSVLAGFHIAKYPSLSGQKACARDSNILTLIGAIG